MTTALNTLHAVRIVHLDVKPGNIFVDMSGDFFLGDFGSARVTGGFGFDTPTTWDFMPSDIAYSSLSSSNSGITHDKWMLATTMAYMMSDRTGCPSYTKSEVLSALGQLGPEAEPLIHTLTQKKRSSWY